MSRYALLGVTWSTEDLLGHIWEFYDIGYEETDDRDELIEYIVMVNLEEIGRDTEGVAEKNTKDWIINVIKEDCMKRDTIPGYAREFVLN